MGRASLVVVFLAVATAGCRADRLTSVTPTAALVRGWWYKDVTFGPTWESWALALDDTTITGQGSWGGGVGQLTITGRLRADSVHLLVDYWYGAATPGTSPDFANQFDGTFISVTELVGTERTPVTEPVGVRFYKPGQQSKP